MQSRFNILIIICYYSKFFEYGFKIFEIEKMSNGNLEFIMQEIASPAQNVKLSLGLKLMSQGVLMPELSRFSLIGNQDHQKKNILDRRTVVKLIDRIEAIKQNRYLSIIFKKLKGLISLNYRKNYNFHEEWQNNDEEYTDSKAPTESLIFSESSMAFLVIQIILIFIYVIIFWMCSIQVAFQFQTGRFTIGSIIFLAATIIDMLKDLNKITVVQNKVFDTRKEICVFYLKNYFYIDAFSIIAAILTFSIEESIVIRLLEGAICLISFIKFKRKYFDYIRDRLINDQNIDKIMSLLELFMLMLMSAHLFGLCLYCVGNSETFGDKNWITMIGIESDDWMTKYLYSIYWATTILVTVGFGDITPQNKYEVAATMTIQFIGVALFGYFINTIGMTMAEIKKSSEKLNQQLKIVNRLSTSFGLTPDLSFRMKQYIRNSNKAQETFSLEEEKKMMGKLSPHLILRILHETNIRVVKKSVFFISSFTKNFQNQIAMKLKKRLFQPEQPIGPQLKSLFIIDQGLIEVFYRRSCSQRSHSKLVKIIKANKKVPLGYNIYGYTSLITNCETNLHAISKTTTKAYQLEIEDFKEVISKNPIDLESYFEIRDKIMAQTIIEAIQGPLLIDTFHHYGPSHFFIIKRHLFSPKQKRKCCFRYRRQKGKALETLLLLKQNMRKTMQKSKRTLACSLIDSVFEDITKIDSGHRDIVTFHTKTILDLSNIPCEFAEAMKEYEKYKANNNFSYVIAKYSKLIMSNQIAELQKLEDDYWK